MDPLRLYLVFDQEFANGENWFRWLIEATRAIGMQRDERGFGVPVQFRSIPWGADQPDLLGEAHPRRIDLTRASMNCVLVLVDNAMAACNPRRWTGYFDELRDRMAKRDGGDLLIPVLIGADNDPFFPDLHGIRNVASDLPARIDDSAKFSIRCQCRSKS